jgi:hypothetical protein
MEGYIINDLVKYVICSYIQIPVLKIINSKYINAKRIYNDYIEIDDYTYIDKFFEDDICIQKRIYQYSTDGTTNILLNYNNNSKNHGYIKKWHDDVMICKILCKNGIKIKE